MLMIPIIYFLIEFSFTLINKLESGNINLVLDAQVISIYRTFNFVKSNY